MLVLEWKERAFIEKVNFRFFVDFRRPYWCTKTVHQYGVSIQSSTKEREMFWQITQKLWATKTWDLDKLFIYWSFITFHFTSFTGRFPIYFFVTWKWERSIIRKTNNFIFSSNYFVCWISIHCWLRWTCIPMQIQSVSPSKFNLFWYFEE